MSYMFSGAPGMLRPSQVITSFGPGSIAQMTHDSVLIMGFDRWSRKDDTYRILHHPYLQELLGKDEFRMPRAADGPGTIACRTFPTWGVCTKCHRLQRHESEPPRGKYAFECEDCGHELYPAAFVLVCGKGHMDEFPWIEWAHSKGEICDNPRLRFKARGKSLGNSDYYVRCDTCGAQKSCGRATSAAELADIVGKCNGRRPWLGDTVECDAKGSQDGMRGVSIRATSLYYPSVVTALYIPEWSNPIQKTIEEHTSKIRELRTMNSDLDIAERWPGFEEHRKTYATEDIAKQIKKWFTPRLGDNPDEKSEMHIRQREYESLISGKFGVELEISDSPLGEDMCTYVDKLRQVSRITEIRVIRGFTRGRPPDPYSTRAAATEYHPISRERLNWYPAIENNGEGLLFSINKKRLAGWETRQDVVARCSAINEAYRRWTEEREWNARQISPRYLLLHTLSHVLIRTVAYFSGYGEASIRERVYSEDDAGGVMLYTANPSADGSLGGLVRQGRADNFERILRSAIERARRCSRDPLCADDDPIEKSRSGVPAHARLNGAACYGCALLPETSCENANQLLDRRLLFDETYGFFRDLGQNPKLDGA